MNWNIRNDAPVYTQLVDQIARAIILGQFPPGRRLAQAGIDAFWQALAQLGYDRAQALELLQQDLRQTKEEM